MRFFSKCLRRHEYVHIQSKNTVLEPWTEVNECMFYKSPMRQSHSQTLQPSIISQAFSTLSPLPPFTTHYCDRRQTTVLLTRRGRHIDIFFWKKKEGKKENNCIMNPHIFYIVCNCVIIELYCTESTKLWNIAHSEQGVYFKYTCGLVLTYLVLP